MYSVNIIIMIPLVWPHQNCILKILQGNMGRGEFLLRKLWWRVDHRTTWTSSLKCNQAGTIGTSGSSPHPELDSTFSNAKEAFRSKTTWEVFRATVIFHLLTINFLVDNQMKLIKVGRKVLGETLFAKMMEKTFFGHFVAGTDQVQIAPKIQRMRKFGVNAILDYSAEEDVAEDAPPLLIPTLPVREISHSGRQEMKKFEDDISYRRAKAVCRMYFYKNEESCDKNMDIFLNSIQAVAGTTEGTGFAAIKVTAIAKPQLLLRLSEAIERVHVFIEHFTGINDAVGNQKIKHEQLKKQFAKAAVEDPKVQAWLDAIDSDSEGIINLLPWKSLLLAEKHVREAMTIPNVETGKLEPIVTHFSDEETQALKNAIERCHVIFTKAKSANVRVMVDAEQSYLQPAISRLTLEMMKIYNTERAIVFNTYQCYLKSAYHNIVTDLNQAERQNFFFGAKLVRGAYMEQERQRAESLGYEDPINPDYESTSRMYEKGINEFLTRIKKNKASANCEPLKLRVMAASHNEDTVRFVINKMKEYGIHRSDKGVCFGQLYGMCDQISFPLGQSGYQVYKYVPYGPVLEVLPYLSRRAQENRGFLGKTSKERQLLRTELWRRIRSGQFNYSPDAN